jgi:hypothetical protein
MLVAVSSMANIGSFSQEDAPGILYEDLWEAAVRKPFEKSLNLEEPHCPVLAALEGLSCAVASVTPQLYLKDTRPLFFPPGKLICSTISIGPDGNTYCSFLLPEICSPPLGLVWPTNVGFDR